MALATPPTASALLTYEAYMTEGTIEGRYDILDGVRIFMPGATWRHQRIAGNTLERLRQFERTAGTGLALCAPFDVLLQRHPLRTRQPDVLFITHVRLAQVGGIPEIGPLETAPEIVVEILSDSETEQRFSGKLADYATIGVEECWKIAPDSRTVEVLRLTPNGYVPAAVYDDTQTLQSVILPELTVAISDIFIS